MQVNVEVEGYVEPCKLCRDTDGLEFEKEEAIPEMGDVSAAVYCATCSIQVNGSTLALAIEKWNRLATT